MSNLLVEDIEVKLSNLSKVFWPERNITKGDMLDYYIQIYPYIEQFLRNRPLSLKIYPDGINGHSFFQKNMPDYAPDWLSTTSIYSRHRQEAINWVVVNKLPDLIWVVNRASIELHCWFSTIDQPDKPDFAVFDLDPGYDSNFEDIIVVASVIKDILDQIKISSYLKTSGKRGLHIYIPVKNVYRYDKIKSFLKSVAEMVVNLKPNLATIEWRKKKRNGRVSIDYRQNGQAKTLPTPYSLRPTSLATVSTPLLWEELLNGISPDDFTLDNIKERLTVKGDLWSDFFNNKQELPDFLIK